jgi:hypothetical protein
MFTDIFRRQKKENQIPSLIEINYFKDGEGLERDVILTEKELLDSLPIFMHGRPSKKELNLFVDSVRGIELMKKVYNLIQV